MAILRQEKRILSDVSDNHNKYWCGTLTDTYDVILEWGRVGNTLQSKTKSFGEQYQAEKFLDEKLHEKEKKGYSKLDIISNGTITVSPNKSSLAEIAKSQIVSDDETLKLIDKLSQANIHNILIATTLTFQQDSGLFSTPLGIVTSNSIQEARQILNKISTFVEKADFKNTEYHGFLNQYLRLIPQRVGYRLNPETLYPNLESIKKQNDILDSLDASYQQSILAPQEIKDAPEVKHPSIFSCELKVMSDASIIDRIDKKYRSTLQSMHYSSIFKVKKVYTVKIDKMEKEFKELGEKIGNLQELWHGTKISNLLSILKSGLIVPPPGNPNVTGRMFGDYLYFSDQSTKSLNYATNYWSGGSSSNNDCFMFLAEVCLGKSYTPKNCISKIPDGYDSIFAKGGYSGVANNEMVIKNLHQANLKFLVEFSK